MSPAHHQLHHSADPVHFNCNMGASLALWDWLMGSLRMPPVEPPRLAYGASGHTHDPHGVMGLVVDPALKAFARSWRGLRDAWPADRSAADLPRSLRRHRNVRRRAAS